MADCASTTSSDLAVGTNAVLTGQGRLTDVILFGGSAASSVVVYDNVNSATGNVLARFNVGATTTWSHSFSGAGVAFNVGLTAVVAGTGAIATLTYCRG
jgi:hypothetical protein